MDCIPDISHNEQLSLLFRIVTMNDDNSHCPEIQEYFLDLIPVQSTTRLNLSNVLIDKLNEYGIDIMNHRRQVMHDNGSNMVVKQCSEKRWESRVNSVKAQLSNIIEALEEVSETANDSISKSDARSLITEISTYEFIISLIIWYDILVQVNIGSKESGFTNAKIIANNLAEEIEIEPVFKKTRPRKKKKNFDYEGNDERINDEEENFRQEYFLLVIDQATSSFEKRFKQIESYKDYFGFLFRIGKLRFVNDDNLMKYCKDLEINLKMGIRKILISWSCIMNWKVMF
ncbi:unnamed protein product [Macrosiphum euphorbiae]|uniref:Uncharacterized protein n=1 Tax=Macrosiphum euphorbiae TaxID=13131 RepID=A0AAV0W9R9_9HEMI|nr:unnamed protein product [Macrosiphum euphorbiae]